MNKYFNNLLKPVDISSTVWVRVFFGLTIVISALRYYLRGSIGARWVKPVFYFTYPGFDWVAPWPEIGMYLHVAMMGLAGLLMALGLFYRLSATIVFFTFTYLFLLDQTHYLNHYYLMILLAFLFIYLPMHRAFSLDVLRKPSLKVKTIPAWQLWLLRFQIGVPYFFGGIAKINADWLQGEPMRIWLARRADDYWLGEYFTETLTPYFFSYGGLLFDLLIVPALLWRKTRVFAFLISISFHFMNTWLFNIGVFPWLMLLATTIFFEPDWPRRFWNKLLKIIKKTQAPLKSNQKNLQTQSFFGIGSPLARQFFIVFVAVQILLPFRHFLYPGNVSWTEEGHNFAWHMKLRDKRSRVLFVIKDPSTNQKWKVKPRKYLSRKQVRKMSTRPEMIRKFAHYLAEEWKQKGIAPVEVYVKTLTSLNGRKRQRLIDPQIDLAKISFEMGPASWIEPLKEPLQQARLNKRK